MKQKHQSLERSSQRSLNAKHLLFTLMLLLSMTACNDNEPQVINYYLDNPATVQGQLSGKFSVSPTKKVSFSQGNLQYNAKQNVWRFATNQYDFVGDATMGTVKIGTTKCNNALISNDYNGWIDLFGWGTGDNPTMSSNNYYYYPTFVDWGQNRIYNGGDKVNLWRTLTKDEWVYLFHGRKDADKKFTLGHIYMRDDKIDSINGIFLVPDKWSKPDDVEFNLSADNGLEWLDGDPQKYVNSVNNANNFVDNGFTPEEWAKLEDSGVVFLPLVGYRIGTDMSRVDTDGNYWSANAHSSWWKACYIDFKKDQIVPAYSVSRTFGFAVRLVR